ncbi:Crp/Fnr family transcriptional regulator [Pseudomonadota bacterium]
MISSIKEIIENSDFPEGTVWKRRSFQSHEAIVQEGDDGQTLFLITAGTLRVTASVIIEEDRRVQPGLCDLSAGDLFGELCLFGNHPRSASVVAVTDGELIEIDAKQLRTYMDANPETGYLILKELFDTITQRLNKANKRAEQLFSWGLKAHGIHKHL